MCNAGQDLLSDKMQVSLQGCILYKYLQLPYRLNGCFTDIPFTPDMVVIGIILSSVSQATGDVRGDGTTG